MSGALKVKVQALVGEMPGNIEVSVPALAWLG
jgi:hypothetical protein